MGKQGTATPLLLAALDDKDPNIRSAAIESLGEVGAGASAAVPRLSEFLKGQGERAVVIQALGRIGPGASAAVPVLIQELRTAHHGDRESAAEALGRIGAAEAVHALADATRDPVADVRWYALNALARVGLESPEAMEALRWALHEDRHEYVRRAATDAILRRSKAEALAILGEGLSSPRWGTRAACLEGLGRLGAEAAPALPKLRQALSDEDRDVRRAAAEATGRIGPAALPAAPDLERLLTDFHRRVRRAAAEALTALGRELPEGTDPDRPVSKPREPGPREPAP
jgi:HEAT repeat protein